MIALEDVEVRLGGRLAAGGVTLEVPGGGWTTLIGPNGAGKSTLLRAVAGLVAHSGRIAVDGRDLRGVPAHRRARLLASVPQSPLLPPDMTVGEYVLLGRTAHLGLLGRAGATDHRAAAAAAERLDLAVLSGRRLGELSGGERQRAVLARALLDGGRLVAHGSPDEVLTEERVAAHYRARVRILRLDASPVVVPAR